MKGAVVVFFSVSVVVAQMPNQALGPAQRKHICYENISAHNTFATLLGNWELDRSLNQYFNLSCRFFLPKYSCAWLGDEEHARRARMRFEATKCKLLDVDGDVLAHMLRNRSLVLIGDSLIRQVYSSIACLTKQAMVSSKVPYYPCLRKEKYCIQGFNRAPFATSSFSLRGGGTVLYENDGNRAIRHLVGDASAKRSKDVIVVEGGLHADVNVSAALLVGTIQRIISESVHIPHIVYMERPPLAFQTKGQANDGHYDPAFLRTIQAQNGRLECVASVNDTRGQIERKALRTARLEKHISGVLSLAGIDQLGHTKVGRSFMKFGGIDCTHYCEPGVPGQLARALHTLIFSLHSERT